MKLECTRETVFEKRAKSLAKQPSPPVSIPLWIVFAILSILVIGTTIASAPPSFAHSLSPALSISSRPFNFGNQTIALENEELHFTHGFYQSPDGQHVARITDLSVNGSITKAAAILIDNPVGSGIFFYVVGAAHKDGKERYSKPVFLGDRIQIEAVSVGEDTITVHYLDRSAMTPLATQPTEKVTVTYTFQEDGNLRATQ